MTLSSIFKMVLLSSAAGSIVAVMVLIIKRLLKNKLNVLWQYYIWFILIARLIVPAGFETPLSKFNVIANTTQSIQTSKNIVRDVNEPQSTTENSSKILKYKLNENKNGNLEEKKAKDINYYFNIASIVWAVGVIFITSSVLCAYGIFSLKVRKLHSCEDEEINRILRESKSVMNISKFIPVVYDRYISTPSLFGVINPKILIDPVLLENLSFEKKKHIFLHELAHFKRKDIFINWIILFLEIYNWFNPVIWFAFNRMREDSELACDAYVLSYLEEAEQNKYGETVIELAEFISNVKRILGTSGMVSRGSNIKKRIIMIKNFKKNSFKWTGILISILAAVCMVGITNIPAQAMNLKTNDGALNVKQNKSNYENMTKQISQVLPKDSRDTISSNKKENKNLSVESKQGTSEYINTIKKFLPKNSQIVTSDNTKKVNNILLADIDSDEQNEIITSYKLNGQNDKMNVMVLKKVGKKWAKVLDESGEGFKVDCAVPADIDGDGEDELLLGRRIGGTTGQLSVYKWNNNVLSKISKEDMYYSKLDLVNIPGKNMKALAVWKHDTMDAYMVDVVKWNGKVFESAEDLYPNYFKQSVIPYYEQKVKEMPKTGFYWYYLADSQIKAGDKKAALKSIEEGLGLNTGYPPQEEFNKLKVKALK